MKLVKRTICVLILAVMLISILCNNTVINAESTSFGTLLETQTGVLGDNQGKTFSFSVKEESLISVVFIGENNAGNTSGAFKINIRNQTNILFSKSVSIYEYNYQWDIKLEKGEYNLELIGDSYSDSNYCFYIKAEKCLLDQQSGKLASLKSKSFSFDLETKMDVHINFSDKSYGSVLAEIYTSQNVLVYSKVFNLEYDFFAFKISLPAGLYTIKLFENDNFSFDYSFNISGLPINDEVKLPTVNSYYPIKLKYKVLNKGKSISYGFSLTKKYKLNVLFYEADGDYQLTIKKGKSCIQKYRGELYDQRRTLNIVLSKGSYKLIIKANSKFKYYLRGKVTKAESTDKNNFRIKSLSKKKQVLKQKAEHKLRVKATFLDPYITWKSSNNKIARVDSEGYVYGKNLGKTKVTAKLFKSNTVKYNIIVNRYYKTLNISPGKKYNIKNVFKYCASKGKFSISNKKVIKIKNKKIIAKKEGSATVTYKKSGIKYTLKVKVKYKKPIASMYISDYDTRNNIIEAWVYNSGKGVMKLYSKGAKLIDWDYTSYDRNLHLTNNQKSVTIKPNKRRYVRFKVEGALTYPGTNRKDIQCKMNYDGKNYWIAISDSGYIWKNGRYIEIPEE